MIDVNLLDVKEALEEAAKAMNAYHHTDEDGTAPIDQTMREAARVAVMAFLEGVKDWVPSQAPLRSIQVNTPSRLLALVKEA